METLHLTLKKKWFDMIASGVKKEEYRENKPYWRSRLQKMSSLGPITRTFDVVAFRNGYSANAPKMSFRCVEIKCGVGEEAWGAPPREVYIIKLGERID